MTKTEIPEVFVTGASGFLGSHLVEALLTGGQRVRALVRPTSAKTWLPVHPRLTLVAGDLASPATLQDAVRGVSTIFHCAAVKGSPTLEGYRHTNVHGTEAIIEAALREDPPPRLVYVSSAAVVGPSHGAPVTESSPCHPVSTYGETKLEGERALRHAHPRLPWVVIRPPVIMGPRDRDLLLFFSTVAKGWIPRPAGPPRHVAILYMEDVVRALLLVASHQGAMGQTYHLANECLSWEDMGRLAAEALGRRARLLSIPRPLFLVAGFASELLAPLAGTTFNREKVREAFHEWRVQGDAITGMLGFRYAWSLREGITKTVAWYREHRWIR